MAPPIFTLVEDGDGKFVIVDNAIKLAAPLNFDTAPSHRVTVAVSGVTPAVANKTFTITVIDIDPVISLSETSVLETAPVGTFVGNLSVSDVTGTPVYTLVDSAGGRFSIDGSTLEVAGPLDFATSAYHSITVAASGFTPASENRTFTISVLQAESVIALSSLSIPENITNGTTIGTLSVLGGTGTYTFTITSDPDGLFTIDSEDLDKFGLLDYETSTSHEVTIQADNGAGDVITQILTINVTNVVDTAVPAVSSFSPADNTVFVEPDADLVVTWDTVVTLGTGNIHLKKTSDNTIVETWDVATEAGSTAGKVEVVGGTQLTMHTTTDMPVEELYVIWDAGVVTSFDHDVAALSSITTWSFAVGALSVSSLTPGAVYAFRKLVPAYAGQCVRIRASGDNVESDFGFVDNEVDTAGIAAFITTHGGSPFIVTQYDQSGNGIDVTQATPANQPAFIASGINGLPTARYDGSNDTLSKASVVVSTFTSANQITIMSVAEQDGTQVNNTLFACGNFLNGISMQFTANNVLYWYFGTDDVTGNVSVAQPSGWDDNPHVVETYREVAGTQATVIDGVSLVSASRAATTTGTIDFYIGSDSGSLYFKGDISELIILKTDIGSSSRAVLRGNLSTRYGIIVW